MAVKIVRQANRIALLGAPTSAAALSAGHEGAPAALRGAGLVDRLTALGYQVADFGDDPAHTYQADEESPRARNLREVLAALEALKPRVEQAVKSCALPVILSGDCSVALAAVAGARRYFRRVSMIYMDRDGDLNTPATTPSGSLDGMVVSHLTGRGAAELVRFWPEPPLVRDPDLALFGVDRLDPSEEEALRKFPLRSFPADEIKRMGAGAAAQLALERVHAAGAEFVLHLDVDVIADFPATNYPGSGGLTLDDVREALHVFAQAKNLAALEVTAYNPSKDPEGSAAKTIVDLLAGALEKRLQTLNAVVAELGTQSSTAGASGQAPASATTVTASTGSDEASAEGPAQELPDARPGESWSSESEPESPEQPAGAEGDGAKPQDETEAGESAANLAAESSPSSDSSDAPEDRAAEPSRPSGEPAN